MTSAAAKSFWRDRWAILLLSLAGGGLSAYLAAYQIGLLPRVWDPAFGEGSVRVLHSFLSRALPVPDALLGAVAYATEAVATLIGGAHRAEHHPRWVLAADVLMFGMALASLGLVLLQAFVIRAWCLLCLTSAAISWAVAAVARREAQAAFRASAGRS